MKENNKIIKFSKNRINIGFIIFFIIFIYIIFSFLSYIKIKPISEYEVTQGTIATNKLYKGLVIRDEAIIMSTTSGSFAYYTENCSKAGVNDIICSIDNANQLQQEKTQADISTLLSTNQLSSISEKITDFRHQYDFTYFQTVSEFKLELESKLSQSINSSIALDESHLSGSLQMIKPASPGIILHNYDGMENLSVDSFHSEHFNQSSYNKINLERLDYVEQNQPIYREVFSEKWNLIVPVESELAKIASEKNGMYLRFCKDNFKTYANYSLTNKENQYYLVFEFQKGMIRYANDRYLDIELIVSEQTGLKIPNSSIVEKNFYKIPLDCFLQGGDSQDLGLLIKRTIDDETIDTMVYPTIYFSDEEYAYIDNEFVRDGEIVLKEDHSTYLIGTDIDSLKGVYNINKGYAVFKQIKIIAQNEDYSIVELKTKYGLSLYDHIALEGNKIIENQTIKK